MHAITAFPHLTFPMHSDAFCIISTEYSCHAFKPLFASGIAQSRGTSVMVMHRCLTYAALATNTYNNGFIIKGNTPRVDRTENRTKGNAFIVMPTRESYPRTWIGILALLKVSNIATATATTLMQNDSDVS